MVLSVAILAVFKSSSLRTSPDLNFPDNVVTIRIPELENDESVVPSTTPNAPLVAPTTYVPCVKPVEGCDSRIILV